MSEFTLDLEDYALNYIRQGSGPPLLLVHGSVSDSGTWKKHVNVLAEYFDVIVPTLRYFGKTRWPDDGREYGSTRHATDLLSLADELKIQNIFCVGWSYGGNVALHAGLQNPSIFNQMFLYEPATASLLEDSAKRELAVADRIAMFSRTANLLKTGNAESAIETFLDDAVGKDGAFNSMPEYVKKASLDNAETLNLLLNMVPPTLSLKKFSLPTVIACGNDTRDFYKFIASGLEEQCSCISVKWIPDANHLWPVLNVEKFCAELTSLRL